jgi:hypothetical protein
MGVLEHFLFRKKNFEVSSKISNPFCKDIFNSLHLAKPYTLINMNECLSLDILNFVPIENYSFYIKWENVGVSILSHLIDYQRKDFYTFEQIRQKVKTKNFMQYYSILSSVIFQIGSYISIFLVCAVKMYI